MDGGNAERPDFGTRQAPRNIEAEAGLLGAIFVDNRSYERVSDFLRPEHFYLPAHHRIYEAVCTLLDRGQIADPTTLRPYFEHDDSLTDIGGAAYLGNLTARSVSVINAKEYGRIVYRCAKKRSIIELGNDMADAAYEADLDDSPDDILDMADARLLEIAESNTTEDTREQQMERLRLWITEGVPSIATGLHDFDRECPLIPGDLIVVAGRPSMGKSVFAKAITDGAAREYAKSGGERGAVAGVISLEMSAEQWGIRCVADLANVPYARIMQRKYQNDDEPRKVLEAWERFGRSPVLLDARKALTVAQIRRKAIRWKRKHNLGLLAIDWTGHIRWNREWSRMSKNDAFGEITRNLKILAGELNIPVVLVHQLNRSVEQRENKRPQLMDLRESGNIEQDADAVVFLYRDHYYLQREPEPDPEKFKDPDEYDAARLAHDRKLSASANTIEIIIGKQRMGEPSTVTAHWEGGYARITDRAHGYQ